MINSSFYTLDVGSIPYFIPFECLFFTLENKSNGPARERPDVLQEGDVKKM